MCVCVLPSYQKGDEAPLRGLPFEAAVDVSAVAYQDHDAPLHSVEVLLEQLEDARKKKSKDTFKF